MFFFDDLALMLQKHFQMHKSRSECFSGIIFSLFSAESVNFRKLSNRFLSLAKPQSIFRRIQNFFTHVTFDYHAMSLFIVNIIKNLEGPYIVTVDRSNWKYGSTNINFLVIGIVYKNLTIPIVWRAFRKPVQFYAKTRLRSPNRFAEYAKAYDELSGAGVYQ